MAKDAPAVVLQADIKLLIDRLPNSPILVECSGNTALFVSLQGGFHGGETSRVFLHVFWMVLRAWGCAEAAPYSRERCGSRTASWWQRAWLMDRRRPSRTASYAFRSHLAEGGSEGAIWRRA